MNRVRVRTAGAVLVAGLAAYASGCSGGPPKEHGAAIKELRGAVAVLADGKPKWNDAVATDRFLGACADLGHLADGTEPGLSGGERKRLTKAVATCHLDPAETLRVARALIDD